MPQPPKGTGEGDDGRLGLRVQGQDQKKQIDIKKTKQKYQKKQIEIKKQKCKKKVRNPVRQGDQQKQILNRHQKKLKMKQSARGRSKVGVGGQE